MPTEETDSEPGDQSSAAVHTSPAAMRSVEQPTQPRGFVGLHQPALAEPLVALSDQCGFQVTPGQVLTAMGDL